MRALRAELSKLLSLPFAWLAFAAGLVIPIGMSVLTSVTTEPGPDTGFSELAIGGIVGVIILGVVVIGSEYTTEGEESAGGRQITTTLTAVPSRLSVMLAKIATVIVASALMAIVAIVGVFVTTNLMLGADAPSLDETTLARMGGALLYWVLTALLAFALTVLTRNGIIPMAILVANSSAVTVTYLLAQRIPLANYLPDLAGMRMFTSVNTDFVIAPVTGGIVMTAWVVVLLVVAGTVFTRRDA